MGYISVTCLTLPSATESLIGSPNYRRTVTIEHILTEHQTGFSISREQFTLVLRSDILLYYPVTSCRAVVKARALASALEPNNAVADSL